MSGFSVSLCLFFQFSGFFFYFSREWNYAIILNCVDSNCFICVCLSCAGFKITLFELGVCDCNVRSICPCCVYAHPERYWQLMFGVSVVSFGQKRTCSRKNVGLFCISLQKSDSHPQNLVPMSASSNHRCLTLYPNNYKLEMLGSIVSPCSLWCLCEPEHTLQKANFLARNMLSRSSCWGS